MLNPLDPQSPIPGVAGITPGIDRFQDRNQQPALDRRHTTETETLFMHPTRDGTGHLIYTKQTPLLFRACRGPFYRALVVAIALCLGFAAPQPAFGQIDTPIYVDDSPAAETAISRALELASVGNVTEAIDVLQRTMNEFGGSVTQAVGPPDRFISIRQRIHTILLDKPELLERYRTLQRAQAEALLRSGHLERVERDYLLTPPGCDAALRLAQQQIEDARFQAAAITLLQLDRHPDRTGDRADAAIKLLTLTRSYFGQASSDAALRHATDATLTRWASALGIEAPKPTPRPAPPSPIVHNAFEPSPTIELDGMLSRPLASDQLGEPLDLLDSLSNRNAARRLPPSAMVLHALPTVYRDSVIINDSVTISSWNRFTLKLNWRTRVETPLLAESMGTSYGVDDLSTVQVADGVVVAVTGLSVSGRSAPERYIIALDAETGRQLWGTTLAELELPGQEGAVIRGRPTIDQGVIVLNAVRHSRQQRVISTTALGLDLRTGELLWSRPIASIGVQPYGWNVPAVDAGVAGNGLVFRTDTIGVTVAIEAATGRTRWIQRHQTEGMYTGLASQPWMNNRPVLHAGLLFSLTPGHDRIHAYDPLTGELIQSLTTSPWGAPRYLLSCGDYLVGVSENEITAKYFDASAFHSASNSSRPPVSPTARSIYNANPRGIRGRVIATNGRLVIPTDSGVDILEVGPTLANVLGEDGAPEVEPVQLRLEYPGQIAAVEGQLVVADDRMVHTYSLWSVAEQYLTQAMQIDPSDPDPAITFAELSYQADQGEAILPAVDHALRALASDPLSETNDEARTRLFRVILEMIAPEQSDNPVLTHLSEQTRGELINRLSLTASLPTERVAYMMAAGDYYETSGQINEAVNMYQRALESQELARATVSIDGTGLPAGIEATRRIRRLVASVGREVYSLYDAEAERAVAELPESPSPGDYEAIARRYPLAERTPELWTLAAEAYLASERVPLAVFALEEAATAAEIIWPADDPRVSEVYSRVIAMMLDQRRVNTAIDRLRRAELQGIPVSLMIDGTEYDRAALRELAIAIAQQRQRRPIVGETLSQGSTLEGWVVARLESPGPEIRTDRIVMRRTDSRIGVFAPSEDGTSIVQLWGDVRDELPLRIENDRLILATIVDRAENVDHVIRCRDLDTGEILWDSQPFRAQFNLEPLTQPETSRVPSVQTPLRSRVRLNEITYNFDAGTISLFERSGRAIAIDLSDGRTLWTRTDLMDVVHDVDAAAGLIVVAGSNLGPEQWFDVNHRPEDRQAVVQVLEARTGRTLHARDEPVAIRWVRVTPDAEAILGVENGIVSIDAHRGMVRWRNDADFLSSSRIGLPLLGKFIVRGAENNLWMIDPDSGTVAHEPLVVRGRLDRGFGRVEVTDLARYFAVSTERGVVVLNADGETVGADTAAEEMMVLPAAFGDSHFVHISRDGVPVDEDYYRYRLTLFALPDGRAVAESGVDLQGDPSSVALLDDLVIVSAYRNSVILSAPAPDNPDRKPRIDPKSIRPIVPSDVVPEPDEAESDEAEPGIDDQVEPARQW
ncbi:MAG: PQQ-binding-like beta-propeller repeat protein [Phycisphaerales bacterium JB050]